jgi:hypothetical protein
MQNDKRIFKYVLIYGCIRFPGRVKKLLNE